MNCPLCYTTSAEIFHQNYLTCACCGGIFKDEKFLLSSDEERKRYLKHENDVNDAGYQKFTSPITNAVLHNFTHIHAGLDFGAGPSSVISKILKDNHYNIATYDPFFFPSQLVLQQTYNYIVCCEVMEHFYKPAVEFSLLRSLLKPGGKLFCMTHLYDDSINFEKWYYRNDPTHVFIYRHKTVHFIAKEFGFSDVQIDNRLLTFSA